MKPQQLQMCRSLHAGFMASVVIYGIVLEVLSRRDPPFRLGLDLSPMWRDRAALVLTLLYLGSVFLYRTVFRYGVSSSPSPTPSSTAAPRYLTMLIWDGAVTETGAIAAMALVLLGAPMQWFYCAAAVVLVLQAGAFPTEERFEAFASRISERPR